MAENARGQWSIHPASFRFEIVMPVYRRTWFIFLVIGFLSFLIYFIRMQRLKQRYRIEKVRLTIARDLHDDIGSTLGSINLLSKTATRKLEKVQAHEDIAPIFEKIGQSAEHTLEAMDDIVWAINPDKDRMQDLVIRMREFAIPLLESRNLEFDFSVRGNQDQTVPMKLRRHIFLIFKESIYNVLKHAEARKATVELNILSDRVELHITDDGQGFDLSAPSQRNGLKNLQQRAEDVGGTLTIHSSCQGTCIVFKSPIR